VLSVVLNSTRRKQKLLRKFYKQPVTARGGHQKNEGKGMGRRTVTKRVGKFKTNREKKTGEKKNTGFTDTEE